jgi:ankyrin repeat protein
MVCRHSSIRKSVAVELTCLKNPDLRFQSDPVLKILLAQFEETIRNDDSNQTQPRSTSYLNFFLSLSDSHLLNVVEQGAVPIDRPDADGNFLLHGVVAQQRAVPTVRRILEAGADPAQIDESGITSVHIALNLERKDIAWVLLKTWKMRRGFADGTGAA